MSRFGIVSYEEDNDTKCRMSGASILWYIYHEAYVCVFTSRRINSKGTHGNDYVLTNDNHSSETATLSYTLDVKQCPSVPYTADEKQHQHSAAAAVVAQQGHVQVIDNDTMGYSSQFIII